MLCDDAMHQPAHQPAHQPQHQPQRQPARRARWPLLLAGTLLCAGCSQGPGPTPASPSQGVAQPNAPVLPNQGKPILAAVPQPAQAPPWRHARNWDDYRHQAALRLVAVNRDITYDGPVPEPLLAIPVLEVELNGDGSVRRIQVLRRPGQAIDTLQLAIDAVQRAAPFGPVAHLPRPWKFSETFLFDEQRRFKPRTLDL